MSNFGLGENMWGTPPKPTLRKGKLSLAEKMRADVISKRNIDNSKDIPESGNFAKSLRKRVKDALETSLNNKGGKKSRKRRSTKKRK